MLFFYFGGVMIGKKHAFTLLLLMIVGGWFIGATQNEKKEQQPSATLIDEVPAVSSETTTLSSDTALKSIDHSSQISADEQSIRADVQGDVMYDKIPTPDELFEQQYFADSAEFELEPTIPEIEVIPEALRLLEQHTQYNKVLQGSNKAPLSDDPDHPYAVKTEVALPPSKTEMEVIPFQLEQLERQYVLAHSQSDYQLISEYEVPLPDNPETGEIYQPSVYEASPTEAEMNAFLE